MKIASIQMVSDMAVDANLADARRLLEQARDAGAELAVLPEYFCVFGHQDTDKLALQEAWGGGGPIQSFLAEAARELKLWIAGGSLPVASGEPARVFNTLPVFGPDGQAVARYDKMHLFDVDLPTGESWRESNSYTAGTEPVVVETPLGKLGLAICYDLRFPDLFRTLSNAGATILAVPAAFTRPTGAAHWHVLLRARAIEAAAFVLAAAQTGTHADGRATYGHSLAIDPWGDVLLDMGEAADLGFAEIDAGRLEDVRSRVPVLRHRRAIPEAAQA